MNSRKRNTVFPESSDDVPQSDVDLMRDQDASTHHLNLKKRKALEQSSPTNSRSAHQSSAYARYTSPSSAGLGSNRRTSDNYENIVDINLGGKVTLAQSKVPNFEIVVIKRMSIPDSAQLQQLIQPSHPNIIHVHDIFKQGQSLYTVHEYMSVSLAQMNTISRGKFGEPEIAAVCKEILKGLLYLQSELRMQYGPLGCHDILLSSLGEVKIANIGKLYVKQQVSDRQDSTSLRPIMMELMEPGTFARDPDSIVIQHSDRWTSDIRRFLQLSADASIQQLLQHGFIEKSPGPSCLKPCVVLAELLVNKSLPIFR